MYKSILKNKSFLGYWGSTTLMRLASNMLQFALAIFVLDLTGSALIFSTVLSAIIFPRIIGTPIAGYLADYKDCLRILKLGALGLTALMLSFFLIHMFVEHFADKAMHGLCSRIVAFMNLLLNITPYPMKLERS